MNKLYAMYCFKFKEYAIEDLLQRYKKFVLPILILLTKAINNDEP